MKLDLQSNLVAAITQFKASKDIRYYLNGVYVEPMPDGGALIVATNGHAMGIWRDTSATVDRTCILRIGKSLESACAGLSSKRLKLIDDRLVVVDKFGVEVYVQNKNSMKDSNWELHGTFPSWAKVVPKSKLEQCVKSSLNPAYITMIQRAIALGKGDKWQAISLFQGEIDSTIVAATDDQNFVALVMPMRHESASIPDWFTERTKDIDAPLPGKQPSDAVAEEVTQ